VNVVIMLLFSMSILCVMLLSNVVERVVKKEKRQEEKRTPDR
jgi:hypothetical protein